MINRLSIARRVFPLGTRGAEGPLAALAASYAKYIPVVVFLGLLTSVLEGVGIGLLIPLLALLLADTVPAGIPGPIREIFSLTGGLTVQDQILALGGVVLGLIATKGVVQAANQMLIGWIYGSLGRDIRSTLSERILHLDYATFLERDETRLIQIISTDSWFASDTVKHALQILPAAIGLAVFAAILAWLDWRLFLVVLAGGAIVRLLPLLMEKRLADLSIEVAQSNLALGERMLGIVTDMRAIRVFGQEAREQKRFVKAAERVRIAMFASRRIGASISPSVEFLTSVLFVVLLLTGYWLGLGIPEITAFLVLLTRAQPHARAVNDNRMGMAEVRGSVLEVEWLLDQVAEPGENESSTMRAPVGQAIRFEGVGFTYPGGQEAIRDASFEIRPGIATALIGGSGSGKSTMVNLVCGLLRPSTGRISIGGIPLDRIAPNDWLQHIAIAGQDIELVEGTVAENIAYGRPDATQAEIEEAAISAGAHAFICDLPEGYATRTGQQGGRLSGGQRQRIGLARALLRRPDLLILDEATSAVDALTEQEVLKVIKEHKNFGSALIISHRRSTLASCSEGIVLAEGRVVEAGPLAGLDYYRSMAGDAA